MTGKHLQHLEDIAFTHTVPEIYEIISALVHGLGTMSLKIDGCPAIVVGNVEGFFVSDKGYFNKTPKLYRSIAEIDASKMAAQKKDKLAHTFNIFKDKIVRDQRVLFGDFLFHWSTLKTKTTFQPNIIEYQDPYKDLSRYDLGIAIHGSTYCGVNVPFSEIRFDGVYTPSLQIPPKCWGIDVQPVFKLLKCVDYSFELSKKEQQMLMKMVNDVIRSEHCNSHLSINYDRMTEMGYPQHQRNFDMLTQIKLHLLKHLNGWARNHQLRCKINGVDSDHEGFVFHYGDTSLKLVDRYKFSKANFDMNTKRGWSK